MRRILSVILVLLFACSVLPAKAEEDCPHEHIVFDGWDWVEGTCTYTGADDLEHYVDGMRTVRTHCEDCGETFTTETAYSRLEPHEFTDGVCVLCGYDRNACRHLRTRDGWDWVGDPELTTDRQHHIYTGTRHVTKRCLDCGAVLGEYDETYVDLADHMFCGGGDGTPRECIVCGYVCTHPETSEMLLYWVDESKLSYPEMNDVYHSVKGLAVLEPTCKYCYLELPTYTAMYKTEEPHHYDENGLCPECGHWCYHENSVSDVLSEPVEGTEFVYRDVSAREHEVTYDKKTYRICYACRTYRQYREDRVTETERHRFDENGVCACGHVNTCLHEFTARVRNTVIERPESYRDVGSNSVHLETGTLHYDAYCYGCRMTLRDRTEPYEKLRPHSYSWNGICTDCGHVNTCTHEHVREQARLKDYYDDYTYRDTGDDRMHDRVGIFKFCVFCRDCGMHLTDRDYEENASVPEPHTYDSYLHCCDFCCRFNSCSHPNAYEQIEWDLPEYELDRIDTGSNTEHLVSGRGWRYLVCDDCGDSFLQGSGAQTYSCTEPHFYGSDGVCAACGHVLRWEILGKASPKAGGSVSDGGTFRPGTAVTLTASPRTGYRFVRWTENGTEIGTDPVLTFAADADRTLIAEFKRVPMPAYDGSIELNAADVRFSGGTPYLLYDGKAKTPRVIVRDAAGNTVDPSAYDVTYHNNTEPGTAYVDVVLRDSGALISAWFKIYLPPTEATAVENTADGIRIAWDLVDGAKGYVIYRRAWNTKSSGWTAFARWNNTTATEWTDTKVYAGTRYQYGVKAYAEDPMNNYDLGRVGPLKTTVRITTRTVRSVTPGTRSLTVAWTGSSLFTGYDVQVATDAAFTKGLKTVRIANPKTYRTTIRDLKAETDYYVRVRSYDVFEGMTYRGGWSEPVKGRTQ